MEFEKYYNLITNDPSLRLAENGTKDRFKPTLQVSYNNLGLEKLSDEEIKPYIGVTRMLIGVGISAGLEQGKRKLNKR